MKRSIKIGEHSVPLWLVVVLLISVISVGVLADYVWRTIIISVEIKEPLEIVSYPSELSLYPGETEEFNITIMNHASRNYTVVLDFSLDNETYQNLYVTFSDETYTVVSGQQDLLAWLEVESYAPPINASLTIDLLRIEEEPVFFDDFNDGVADGWTEQVGVGVWEVINGEYYADDPVLEPNPDGVITTVDNLNLSDFTVAVDFRVGTKENGFWQCIVFRYTDKYHHYVCIVSEEYDNIHFAKMTPENYHHGIGIGGTGDWAVPISPGINYSLKLTVSGNNFYAYLNDELITTGSDDEYTTGLIGLRVQGSDCYFDNFTVWRK